MQQASSPAHQSQLNYLLTGEGAGSRMQLIQTQTPYNLTKISSQGQLKNKKYLLVDI
jgi:hypothetical protein